MELVIFAFYLLTFRFAFFDFTVYTRLCGKITIMQVKINSDY